MKIEVKWIYQFVKLPAGGKIEAGQKPSLCFKGRKYMLCVAVGYPVRVLQRPAEDFEKMRQVWATDGVMAPYPVADAVKALRKYGKHNGITQHAKELLQRAEMEITELEDEESFEDEENTFIDPSTPAQPAGVTAMRTDESPASEAINGSGSASERLAGKKRAKSGAKKAPVKAKGKAAAGSKAKTAPKDAGKKPAAAKAQPGDGLGRPGSLSRFIAERLVKGHDSGTISEAAKKAFPDSASTEPSHVSWLRWKLIQKGILKAAKK